MFEEASKPALIDRITTYRKVNNLEPIEHLSFVLESYWCGLPENAGNCESIKELPRGLLGYIRGGIAYLTTMAYKSMVGQEEADKRSEQCASCKYNFFPDRKGFVRWSDEIAESSTLGRKSKKHDELGNCALCSCPLRAKVFYNGTVKIEESWKAGMQEVGCWQLRMDKNG